MACKKNEALNTLVGSNTSHTALLEDALTRKQEAELVELQNRDAVELYKRESSTSQHKRHEQ